MKRHIPVRSLALSALFAAMTAVGAYIRIPTPWSAFSLQVLFVFLAGVLLGPKYGALSQGVYLLLGLVGVPVFVGGGGPMYVLQPTFGFLLSYIPAAAMVGWLCREPRFWKIALSCLAGLAVIYLIGLPYMALILNVYMGRSMSAGQIIMSGMVIFLPFDAVKIVLTAVLGRAMLPSINRIKNRGAA